MIRDKAYWWPEAIRAASSVGWFATVVLAQWQLETTYPVNGVWTPFASPNLLNNNNIAGQTWREYMPGFMKGTARPKAEGGYYIKYEDAVDGYTSFIKTNPRYASVKLAKTEEDQIRAIAAAGWAADPDYASKLISILNRNKAQGYVVPVGVEPEMEVGVGKTIVNTWMKPAYAAAKTKEEQDYIRWLANEVRRACGMKPDEEFK